MKRMRAARAGLTLVEMIVVTMMVILLTAAVVRFMGPSVQYFQKFLIRRQMASEATAFMDLMVRHLRVARPESLIIDPTHPSVTSPNPPPNSRIEFVGRNDTRYEIYWADDHRILMAESTGGGAFSAPRPLARNVGSLTFAVAFDDPGLVSISLHMEAVYGRDRLVNAIPIQTVRLGGAL